MTTAAQRRLAAILAADVAGYSRLMGADEEGTLRQLKKSLAEVIEPRVAALGGRIVKSTGDGVLVEYPSVLQAVRSAIEIQRGMAELNAAAPDEGRLDFRIGINLGDVMIEGGDIFGDGVNVAARLEGMARPGGITVSGAVYEQVHKRLEVGWQDRGAQRVKNIAEPIRMYDLRLEPGAAGVTTAARAPAPRWRRLAVPLGAVAALAVAAAVWLLTERAPAPDRPVAATAKMLFPLPERPSIAVMPFDDLAGGRMGDGLTDTLIASLAKVPGMFVIARDTSFAYQGKQLTAKDVAEALGVRYVLAGGVQTSGAKVRITAQLVDAITGFTLWSGRYDRDLADLFALQDEIALSVITALQIKLTDGDLARVRRHGTDNLEAWLLMQEAIATYLRFTREDNVRARALAEQALALDPKFPEAYIRLAHTYLTDFQTGWAADRGTALKRSIELVQRALAIDDAYPDAYVILGQILLFLHRHDEAIGYAEKAVALSPNHSYARASLGMILSYAGRPEDAIASLRQAMRLSPSYPDWFLGELGRAYILTGQNDEAIAALDERLHVNPASGEGQVLLAAAYGAAGREREARAALARFLEPRPGYTLGQYAAGEYYKDPKDLERVLAGLRKAGLRD